LYSVDVEGLCKGDFGRVQQQGQKGANASNFQVGLNMKSPPTDVTIYRRKVGKLMYLVHTWLDISLVVSIVSRFMA